MARNAGLDWISLIHAIPAPGHALALLAFMIELVARGARVKAVGRGLDLPISLKTAVAAQMSGDAFGAVTPSRVGSDPAKLTVLCRGGLSLGAAGALLLAEMASEVLVLAATAVVVAIFAKDRWVALGIGGYAIVVATAGITALLATRWPASDPPRLWLRLGLGAGRWNELRSTAASFQSHASALRRLPRKHIAAAVGAGVLHLCARLVILPALVVAIHTGLGFDHLVLRPFFVLYATALLPPPAGGGGVEMTFAAALRGGLAPRQLVAVLLWWRVYTFYLGAVVGWLYVVASNARSPRSWIPAFDLRHGAFLRRGAQPRDGRVRTSGHGRTAIPPSGPRSEP